MIYGEGKYRYELVEGWGKYPEGWEYIDVAGISVDGQDRVYVLNRGAHPIMVFDRNGTLVDHGERNSSAGLMAVVPGLMAQFTVRTTLITQYLNSPRKENC